MHGLLWLGCGDDRPFSVVPRDSPKTPLRASTSMGSPKAVPVPWHSMSPTSLESVEASNNLGVPKSDGLQPRSKDALAAPGLTTRSKKLLMVFGTVQRQRCRDWDNCGGLWVLKLLSLELEFVLAAIWRPLKESLVSGCERVLLSKCRKGWTPERVDRECLRCDVFGL